MLYSIKLFLLSFVLFTRGYIHLIFTPIGELLNKGLSALFRRRVKDKEKFVNCKKGWLLNSYLKTCNENKPFGSRDFRNER
jgi:hypothetical protein